MNENEVSKIICDAAIEVHRVLGGPGLLESVYEEALAEELSRRGCHLDRQVSVPLNYKGKRLCTVLRIDLLVERCVVVECKATTQYSPLFESQVLTYLRLTGHKLGMVINFGERYVVQGLHRVVNGLNPS
jgi:GxxExxY protein